MDVLGSVGQLYMFLLLVVMVMGFGLAAWSAINFITTKKPLKTNTTNNVKQNSDNKTTKDLIIKNKKILGGLIMNSNGFFKLAVFSLAGIFISAVILTFVGNSNNSNGQNGMNMQSANTMNNMQGTNGQSNANGQMNMNNQASANGQMNMSNVSNQSNMNGQVNQSNSLSNIEYQLQMMEKQIIQIQQYIQNGNMNSSSQQNNNNNSSTSGGSNSMPMPAAAPAAAPAAPMAMPMM